MWACGRQIDLTLFTSPGSVRPTLQSPWLGTWSSTGQWASGCRSQTDYLPIGTNTGGQRHHAAPRIDSVCVVSRLLVSVASPHAPSAFKPAVSQPTDFTRATLCIARSLRRRRVQSVRLSVTAGIVSSRVKAGSWNVHHLIAPWFHFLVKKLQWVTPKERTK